MSPEGLLDSARRSVDPSDSPTHEDRNRAVSTTYYALFLTLCHTCADLLVGSTPEARASLEWTQAYRALDHAQAKSRCRRSEIDRFHTSIRKFAESFCEFQEHRHAADYSPRANYTQAQVDLFITRAASAISDFNAVPEDERRRFILYVTLRYRTD